MEPADWDAIRRNKDELYRKMHPQDYTTPQGIIPHGKVSSEWYHYTAPSMTNKPYNKSTYKAPEPLPGGVKNPFK